MKRVAITGLGWIAGLGGDVDTVWRRLLAGESAIDRIKRFDASAYPSRVAAEAPEADGDETLLDSIPPAYCRRGVKLFARAASEAFADAGLADHPPDARRAGVSAGTSVNYVHHGLLRTQYTHRRRDLPEVDVPRFSEHRGQPAHAFYRRLGDLAAAVPAKRLGLAGPTTVIDTACAASSSAVVEGCRAIQTGRADVMVAGGGCALVNPLVVLAFSMLGALSTTPDPAQASCPFDRRRNGFVLGEGAGAVVLERWEHAVARGARIYAELAGAGVTMNAHTMTDPSPGGRAEQAAMRAAMCAARLSPEDIDLVCAHGTSTPKNDATETLAIKQVFGARAGRLLVSSHKGQLGHTIAAAGVSSLITAVKAIIEGHVPPTANYREPDPACDLDYVPNESRRARVRAALVNAFAFGGQNVVLAVRGV